jgi:hypothetical protein
VNVGQLKVFPRLEAWVQRNLKTALSLSMDMLLIACPMVLLFLGINVVTKKPVGQLLRRSSVVLFLS